MPISLNQHVKHSPKYKQYSQYGNRWQCKPFIHWERQLHHLKLNAPKSKQCNIFQVLLQYVTSPSIHYQQALEHSMKQKHCKHTALINRLTNRKQTLSNTVALSSLLGMCARSTGVPRNFVRTMSANSHIFRSPREICEHNGRNVLMP